MLSNNEKKRTEESNEQQAFDQQRKKIRRTTKCRDEQELLKWLNRGDENKVEQSHRLQRQSALVGSAFVEFWDRNARPQIELPSLCRKIESFSFSFVTGEKHVTFVNER